MKRRAVILPVVLFILILLGLLAAMFSFRVYADLSSVQAQAVQFQTRLAAEAGVERVKLLLRTSRLDMAQWYQNPEALHRVIVWSEGGDPTVWGKNEELDEGMQAFRFSIVADDPNDDENFIRLGVTDESAKLNLNTATAAQLLALVTQAVAGDEEIDPQTLVVAIVDWKDPDRKPSGSEVDTEGEFYESLDKPYRVKNAPFDTVEELLLVKGITGQILYGEDFDRNGLLTPNEDDEDRSFPPDNQDGKLNRGLYPYLTVLSVDKNVSNDQRPRVSLLADATAIRTQLKDDFPDDPEIIEYLATTGRGQAAGRGTGGTGGRPTTPGAGQGITSGRRGRPPLQPPKPPGSDATGVLGADGTADPSELPKNKDDKLGPRRQRRQTTTPKQPKPGTTPDTGNQQTPPNQESETPREGTGTGDPQSPVGKPPSETGDPATEQPQEGDPNAEGTGGTDKAPKAPQPIRSPAALLLSGGQTAPGAAEVPNPLKGRTDLLAVLLDRVTTARPDAQVTPGLININTAPREVLKCLDGLSEADVEAILGKRGGVDPSLKNTPAWLVTEEVVSLETFDKIAPQITARGQQFTIESLGYADHLGMVTRLQVVVDMMGPVAQTVYYRDLTYLGGHYPIREADKERIGVR